MGGGPRERVALTPGGGGTRFDGTPFRDTGLRFPTGGRRLPGRPRPLPLPLAAAALLALPIGGCLPSADPDPTPAVSDADLNDDDSDADTPPEAFTRFVLDFGDASCVILFAETPIDAVSDAYAAAVGSEIARGVPVTATADTGYGPSGTVAAVKGSDWVQICHRVGCWEAFDAAAFSKILNVPAVAFEAEDTSGSVGLTLYEPGAPPERFLTADDAEYQTQLYEDVGMDPPPGDDPAAAKTVDDYDAFLESRGVRPVRFMIPEAVDDTTDARGGVIAAPGQAALLERVDAVAVTLN